MVTLRIPGKPDRPVVQFYTLKEMAKECGRSKDAFTKLIDRGLMPDANYRGPGSTISRGEKQGTEVDGARLYSVEILAPKLKAIFKNIKQGKQITIQQRQQLMEAFQAEKDYYTNKH